MEDEKEYWKERLKKSKELIAKRDFNLIPLVTKCIFKYMDLHGEVIYIGKSTSFGFDVVCTGEKEIPKAILNSGAAEYLWTSVNKKFGNTYKVVSSNLHFDTNQYRNREMVEGMIDGNILNTSNMNKLSQPLWIMRKDAKGITIVKWLMEQTMAMFDNMANEKTIEVTKSIAENMMKKEKMPIELRKPLLDYAEMKCIEICKTKQERWKMVCAHQASQLPF